VQTGWGWGWKVLKVVNYYNKKVNIVALVIVPNIASLASSIDLKRWTWSDKTVTASEMELMCKLCLKTKSFNYVMKTYYITLYIMKVNNLISLSISMNYFLALIKRKAKSE
jgi:hypothetical protein